MASSMLCKSLFIAVVASVALLLQGCGCDSLSGHEKEGCEACVKNVEDTPFEKKGIKSELKEKCAEGREGQKDVQYAIAERMKENHNETKVENPMAMMALRKGMQTKGSLIADAAPSDTVGHGISWYLP
eukprot:gnl/MRDRNA2_/MRDRNA2_87089_c0_seq1.p1 gnl/MRDRNA2_/MRDRNA2_87089_c0~~gnl/MRDRNA2_/MRDRNA2_87089_c0_seq1.p1  ORF type:complete len:129 (+),score=31.69 gnl/MRDRNA2_/MRDRNA2_87089_c0_seq1:73-459(+)